MLSTIGGGNGHTESSYEIRLASRDRFFQCLEVSPNNLQVDVGQEIQQRIRGLWRSHHRRRHEICGLGSRESGAPAERHGGRDVTGLSATTTIKRSDFNFSTKYPDSVVSDEIKIMIDLELNQSRDTGVVVLADGMMRSLCLRLEQNE